MTQSSNTADKIDIVLLWVDGDDPQWQREWLRYKKQFDLSQWKALNVEIEEVTGLRRYRDWGTLRYVLRSIEQYVPWYHNLFLVTAGHVPDWINQDHPKLICMPHEEFFADASHLPTFNSNAIQMNLPHIPGLAEQYLVWDDDLILTDPLQPSDFFQNGVPVKANQWGMFVTGSPFEQSLRQCYHEVCAIRGGVLTRAYFKTAFKLKDWRLWAFNLLVGIMAFFKGQPIFPGGYTHMPFAMLKSESLKHLQLFSEKTRKTSQARFRTPEDMMTWGQNFMHFAEGHFIPSAIRNRVIFMDDDMDTREKYEQYDRTKYESWLSYHITRFLLRTKNSVLLCVQDHTSEDIDVVQEKRLREALRAYLQAMLPKASSFEKDDA